MLSTVVSKCTRFTLTIRTSKLRTLLIPVFEEVYSNIGIKYGFSCINILQVPMELLKTEAGGPGEC